MNKLLKFLIPLFITIPISAHTQPYLAINIALAIKEPLNKQVTLINQQIHVENLKSFVFDSSHFPHITILQVFISPAELENLMEKVSRNAPTPFKLKMKGFDFTVIDSQPGAKMVNLTFYKNNKLADFQTTLIKIAKVVRPSGNTKVGFFKGEPVDAQFLNYVKDFLKNNSGENYLPHITLGISNQSDVKSNLKERGEYLFDEIIVAHIGNYGTARTILKRIPLIK